MAFRFGESNGVWQFSDENAPLGAALTANNLASGVPVLGTPQGITPITLAWRFSDGFQFSSATAPIRVESATAYSFPGTVTLTVTGLEDAAYTVVASPTVDPAGGVTLSVTGASLVDGTGTITATVSRGTWAYGTPLYLFVRQTIDSAPFAVTLIGSRLWWTVSAPASGTDGFITYGDPAAAIPVGAILELYDFATQPSAAFTIADLIPRDRPFAVASSDLQTWLGADMTRTATAEASAYVGGEWLTAATQTYEYYATPDDIVSADFSGALPELGEPELGQTHELTADTLTGAAPVAGEPAIFLVPALTADNLDAGAPVLGEPALVHTHALQASSLASPTPELGDPELLPGLGQDHELDALGIVSGAPVLGRPAPGQTHQLAASDLAGLPPTLPAPILRRLKLYDAGWTLDAPLDDGPRLVFAHLIDRATVLDAVIDAQRNATEY